MNLLAGKKGVIIGVTNAMSLCYGIMQHALAHGAEIALTYPSEAVQRRVVPIAQEYGIERVYECNAASSDSIKAAFEGIGRDMGELDFIVHGIGFSDKEQLRGRYLDTTLDNFLNTMHVSCYSLVEILKSAEGLLKDGASVLTLTYHGARQVVPNYNVMGVAKAALEASVRYLARDMGAGQKAVRINAISAGPARTLASSAIQDFAAMLQLHKKASPLQRNITLDDVAKSAMYLLSDMSSGVTGEIHYVDCGFSIVGHSAV